MANEERCFVIRAAMHFDELLERVITTRKPIFIDGDRKTAAIISIEEWESIQVTLIARDPSDCCR